MSSSTNIIDQFATGQSEDGGPLWAYVTILQSKKEGKGNITWQCNFCQGIFKGSYSRVKAHLLKQQGVGVKICGYMNKEYLVELNKIISESTEKSRPVQIPLPTGSTSVNPTRDDLSRKRRATGTNPIEKAFNKEAREQLNAEIARLFYSAGLPFNIARNPHYINAFSLAANTTLPGYRPPGYNALRTTLLQREKAHVERLLQPIKNTWPEKGVSIVSDGWTDPQRRPLINIMAASSGGPIFFRSADTSGEYKSSLFIANLIKKAIEEVGPNNVVQVITDNAANCKGAGLLIEETYSHIFWTPCVVHTLNLALKNICVAKNTIANETVYEQCSWITNVADDATFIRNFIMNHGKRLSIFNQFNTLKLLSVADTRFASVIVMLKSFKKIRRGLQAMVIDEKWTEYKDDDVQKADFVKEKILSDRFWDKVDYILSFTKPIYDMLRYCDTDKPTLHLIYDMWDSMIEQVKYTIYRHEHKDLDVESSFYNVVYNILIDRWTKSCTPLHCLAHSLNPRYYCLEWLQGAQNRLPPHKDEEICTERDKCLRRYFSDPNERLRATKEFVRFSGSEDVFSQYECLQHRWSLEPREWWIMYGSSTPLLQNLALKLLSQPCSSSCCERNWSIYSFIHSVRRNKITPKRAEDLVFVHTNLRLLSRQSSKYKEGETKMWDIGGDRWEHFDGPGTLEVASLSLDEPELEADLLAADEGENDEIPIVEV